MAKMRRTMTSRWMAKNGKITEIRDKDTSSVGFRGGASVDGEEDDDEDIKMDD